jgi:hypothetical protein
MLLAILETVCICYWPYRRKYASLTGHSRGSVHVLNPGRRERLCLLHTTVDRMCISDRKKTREHSLVTVNISARISVTAHALELCRVD